MGLIAGAIVKITGDAQSLNAALGQAERATKKSIGNITASMRSIGTGMTVAGAAIVGGLAVMVNKWAEAGDQVEKMSRRTGLSTEELSRFRMAADLSGTSIDSFEKGIKKMQVTLFNVKKEQDQYGVSSASMNAKVEKAIKDHDALGRSLTIAKMKLSEMGQSSKTTASQFASQQNTIIGLTQKYNESGKAMDDLQTRMKSIADGNIELSSATATYAYIMKELNLKYDDLSKLKPEDQFKTIAKALADVEDPTQKAALAVQVFGRAGTDMLPMLDKGSEGLQEMLDQADKLGLVFDARAAKSAADFSDRMTELKGALMGATMQIAQALVPTIMQMIPRVQAAIVAFAGWIKEHQGLVLALGEIGAALAVAGPILIGMASLLTVGTKVTFMVQGLSKALMPLIGMSGTGGVGALGFLGVAGAIALVAIEGYRLGGWINDMIDKYIPSLGRAIDWYYDKLVAVIDKMREWIGLGSNINAGIHVATPDEIAAMNAAERAAGRASGGPVRAGTPYLVGESGPEIFMPKRDGEIKNNSDTQEMMRAGGGVTINGPITLTGVRDVPDFFRKLSNLRRLGATA